MADVVDCIKILRSSDLPIKDQRLRMRDSLRFEVERVGRFGRNLRQLGGEGRSHRRERKTGLSDQRKDAHPSAIVFFAIPLEMGDKRALVLLLRRF